MGDDVSREDRISSESSPSSDAEWNEFFAFDDPYDNQADAIETAIETGTNRGFFAMEGPCGTGKTMVALTTAAYLIRETDLYDNAIIVTPVKQQLRQFIEDLRSLNRTLENPLSGLALVGKTDLCPYGREDVFPSDVSVHDRCEDLRDNTATLVKAQTSGSSGEGAREESSVHTSASTRDAVDDLWWDPGLASELARAARHDSNEFRTEVDEPLITAGARSPYRKRQPSAPETMVDGENAPLFCPFEADWYARDRGSPVGFAHGIDHVLTSDEFLPRAVEFGTCPHRVMGVLLGDAEIVIGNYNHLFDPRTRNLTAQILDDSTFVVVDEAHRLDDRVRGLLSSTIGRQSLRQARGDIDFVRGWATQDDRRKDHVKRNLAKYDVPFSLLQRVRDFYDDVEGWITERTERYFEEEYDGYDTFGSESDLPDRDLEIPLRNPERDEPDELREWAIERGYAGDFWRSLGTIGAAVEATIDEINEDRTCVCTAVGTLFGHWWERDHTTYFREIELEYSRNEQRNLTHQWEGWYAPSLLMYNCIPSDELKRIFSRLGGGLLMSATLEPIDVFREVTGLNDLQSGGDESAGRPVVERTYELQFPAENRASWIVDAMPFTHRNRGEPHVENRNKTRERYAYVLRQIARSRGNVLLCLPNYREAKWAAERIRAEVDKPVLLDESSTNEETTELRERFFAGDSNVLVTSTRGTLTEGVDYTGDNLHTCAVVGIPLVNIASPRVRATKHAYADRFGENNAFEYALTVPAVRRSRQAIGRVIRGPDERGIRILVGNRYTPGAIHNSVYEYLPANEREEFVKMKPMFLEQQFDEFWG